MGIYMGKYSRVGHGEDLAGWMAEAEQVAISGWCACRVPVKRIINMRRAVCFERNLLGPREMYSKAPTRLVSM